MSTQPAYPLCWPPGWPKTDPSKREPARFQATLAGALSNLKKELARMGAKGVVLSSNYTLGSDRVIDPGVVAYFTWQEVPMAIPCDRWSRIEANVQAIALTVKAMRGMERWGAKHMIRAMFSGFKALPAPASSRAWHEVLGVHPTATAEDVRTAYREMAKRYHPDAAPGSDTTDRFFEVQEAFEKWESMR